jgi:hypothetical protein
MNQHCHHNTLNAMNAKRFSKDDQTVWSKDTIVNGLPRTISSACVEIIDEVYNLNTGWVQEEKSLVWIKGGSEELVEKTVNSVIKQVNSGTIKPYRAFSETPFYDGQDEDINPTTEMPLGRYSQVRLCPANKHAELHRQFVTVQSISTGSAQPQPELKIAEGAGTEK